jgi:DNA topoisomerase-2
MVVTKYKKIDHKEHVLSRPGMYIGSIEEDTINTWIYDESSENKIVKKEIKIVPGLYKIFDEIIVNAIDHSTRLKNTSAKNLTTKIEVKIDKETGLISVYNDGDGIAIEKNEEDIYIPELIFGYLLTSSNYNEDEERTIGGQNGIGAKACNIFSKQFKIETVDIEKELIYKQEFSENMCKKTKPKITSYKGKKPFTRISFLPDYEKFKQDGLSDDMYGLFVKRCYDICALTDEKIAVYLDGKNLSIKSFDKYVDLYIGKKENKQRVHHDILNERWDVIASFTDEIGFEQVSFVNGISTIKGGKHVDYIANQICTKLADLINKRKKTSNVKAASIKNYLMLFVNCTIVNPTFDSQSKDALTLPISKFGSKFEVNDKFIEKMFKTDIVEKIMNLSDSIDAKLVKKTDGKKSNRIYGLSKLDDANFAGTNKSKDCTLILTEGDSAKTMALSGIAEVGRNHYGVFPLRGKLLNVKDAAVKKVNDNEEIQNIKKILGLETGKIYKDLNSLRYGRIMIMTDQDYDGSHIRGLIMNLFHTSWHSLLEQDFIVSLLTPIIKATKGNETKAFYNIIDYEKWAKENKGWKIKYYKGLGTSNEKEAKEYFKNMHLINYNFTKDTDNSIDLAFNKKRADDRKKWLTKYDANAVLYDSKVSYSEFVDKELVHFSVYDVKRSIPSMVDGFKPSQRKILYSCFKRNLVEEVKVAQLAGYISEHSGYHHGEVSLQGAIVNMAQDFVGSNNINLLTPNGMFGSRRMGGKDASEARYIFTQFSKLTHMIFRKEDSKLLNYLLDDGDMVEPDYYLPIIPMVLVNGACGIGTGFSTNIPCYNPIDIINSIKKLLKQEKLAKNTLIPWYKGFKGSIEKLTNSSYISKGTFVKRSENIVDITELPIGTWTADYKEFLDGMLEKKQKVLKDFESQYTNTSVHFVLHFYPGELSKIDKDTFEKDFKLINRNISTTNMHLFDSNGIIKKYNCVEDIIEDFFKVRYQGYVYRKDEYIKDMQLLLTELSEKVRFIMGIIQKKIMVMNVSKVDINKQLEKMDFEKIDNSYNYLLNLPIYNLTLEKVNDLTEECKNLEKKIKEYTNKTIENIWSEELSELESDMNSL